MRKLEEGFSEAKKLYGRIDRLPKLSTYDQYDDLSGMDRLYGRRVTAPHGRAVDHHEEP